MKEKKSFSLPPYVMLMLVSVVMSFAIAGVYSVTKDTIEAAALEAQAAARRTVMSEAASMEEVELGEGDPVDYCYTAYGEDGGVIGYVSQITVVGFGGEIEVTVGLDTAGAITGVSVGGKDFSETSGLGAKTREPAFTDQFVGRSDMLVLKQNIDSVTGASISSGAVVSGVNRAVAYMSALLPEEPAGADTEPLPLSEEQIDLLLPGAENVVWMGGGAGVNGWWRADNGYIVRATGFGEGPIAVTMGFDKDGVARGIIIGDENFMETEGRGDRILEDWYAAQFLGRSGVQTYGDGVDGVTGATVTSDAALAAINACMGFDPTEPGEAEPETVLPPEEKTDSSAEPDAVTEATEASAEPAGVSVPDATTEASVPDQTPEPTPDAVTEASVPEEETPLNAAQPAAQGASRRTAAALFVPEAAVSAIVPDAVTEATVPAETPEPTPDAVTEASVPGEEAPQNAAEPAAQGASRRTAAALFVTEAAVSATVPDAVTEATVPEQTPEPTPDAVTEASVASEEVGP